MRLVRLETLDTDEIRDYRDLTDVVLRRLSEPAGGLYIAESTKVIERALRAGHRPRSVLTIEKWLPEIEQLFADQDDDLPVYIGTAELLETLTGFNLHRGALASMHRPELKSVEEVVDGATRIIVLEDIVDHTNVGAIFRSVARSRCRRGVDHAPLRRSAVPPKRPSQHGHRSSGSLDAPAGLAGGP